MIRYPTTLLKDGQPVQTAAIAKSSMAASIEAASIATATKKE